MSKDVRDLFDDAQKEGISVPATDVLVENLNALTVAGAQGASLEEIAGDEVTLVVVVGDETGSMTPYHQDFVTAYNEMLQALKDSRAAESILLSSWMFNIRPRLLHGYLPLEQIALLSLTDYDPNNNTALFDATLFAFTGVVAYGQELRNNGIRTRVVVVILSDGEDNYSRSSAYQVRTVAESLLKQEYYTLAFVAFGTGFAQQVASQMGFPNVLEVDASASSIRRAMGTVSKSVIRASQGKVDPGSNSFFP